MMTVPLQDAIGCDIYREDIEGGEADCCEMKTTDAGPDRRSCDPVERTKNFIILQVIL